MQTRLLKEARQLLPVWLGTLGLMVAPRLFWGEWTEAAGVETLVAFGLGCVLMAGLSFGNELQHRTLGLLLSQPLQRSALWREKMLVLGTGMAVSLGVMAACLGGGRLHATLEPGVVWVPVLVALCAFCGAPGLTLLMRSGIGGVVAAVIFPAACAGMVGPLAERWLPSVGGEPAAVAFLLSYCAVTYWCGYRQFERLEVRDGQTADLALPARMEGALARWLGAVLPGITGPFTALLRKELRLQQVSFVLAALSSGMAVIALVTHFIDQQWSEVLFTLNYAIYLILLPFMAGAMAVAEERGLGLAQWHLTLPVSARQQWCAKMLVTLPTSLGLGLVLPVLFCLAGDILVRGQAWQWEQLPREAVVLLLVQLLATTVAVYAATCCASTLRAILLAFGMIVAGCTLLAFESQQLQTWRSRFGFGTPDVQNWEELAWVFPCVAMVLLLGLLQGLAFANFRRCGVSARGLVLQLVGVYLVLALLGYGYMRIMYSMH